MRIVQLSLLFLTLLLSGRSLEAQDQPTAFLLDEFGKLSQTERRKRVSAFDKRLRENAWSENYEEGVIFIWSRNAPEQRTAESVLTKLLYDDCRDCRGWHSRITFVRAGVAPKLKIQLWIVPRGADNPIPKLDEPLPN
jgi:hypothetical protein